MTKHSLALHYAGTHLSVWFLRLPDGRVPAQEFLHDLNAQSRAAFYVIFEHLADVGRIHNTERFRQLRGSAQIWEFKVHHGPGWRMWGTFHDAGMVVTHGARKPHGRRLEQQVNRAEELLRVMRGEQ